MPPDEENTGAEAEETAETTAEATETGAEGAGEAEKPDQLAAQLAASIAGMNKSQQEAAELRKRNEENERELARYRQQEEMQRQVASPPTSIEDRVLQELGFEPDYYPTAMEQAKIARRVTELRAEELLAPDRNARAVDTVTNRYENIKEKYNESVANRFAAQINELKDPAARSNPLLLDIARKVAIQDAQEAGEYTPDGYTPVDTPVKSMAAGGGNGYKPVSPSRQIAQYRNGIPELKDATDKEVDEYIQEYGTPENASGPTSFTPTRRK